MPVLAEAVAELPSLDWSHPAIALAAALIFALSPSLPTLFKYLAARWGKGREEGREAPSRAIERLQARIDDIHGRLSTIERLLTRIDERLHEHATVDSQDTKEIANELRRIGDALQRIEVEQARIRRIARRPGDSG